MREDETRLLEGLLINKNTLAIKNALYLKVKD
jgi:hypothetical protein